jgi:hypothetical protein
MQPPPGAWPNGPTRGGVLLCVVTESGGVETWLTACPEPDSPPESGANRLLNPAEFTGGLKVGWAQARGNRSGVSITKK